MRIPFALATLVAATAVPTLVHAQSSVTVYGIMDAAVRHASNAGAGGASVNSLADGAYTGSRLGFRGSEDLGDGLKAIFNLEMGIDPSTGTMQQTTATPNYGQAAAVNGRGFGRLAAVGLSGNFGQLSLGRQYTLAHDMSGRFQPQANPNQDQLSVFSGHHVARQDNMLKYTGKFGPVGVGLSWTADEGNGKAWGAAASYTAGPVDLVAYRSEMKSFNGAETRNITGLGGSFAITPAARAFLGGMLRDHDVSIQKNKVLTAGLNVNLSELLILTASYTRDKQSGTGIGSRKVAFVGIDYLLSKRTDVYAEVDNNKITGAFPLPGFMGVRGSQTGLSVGLRHRF